MAGIYVKADGVLVAAATVPGPPGDDGAPGADGDTYVPDPSAQPDDKTLVTAGGALVYADPVAGASAYEDLTDVDMTGLADGDVPVWNATDSEWQPGTPAGGGVQSTTITNMEAITQAAYDALSPPDATTFYVIVP